MEYRYCVFCDFDGTITNWESAEGLWKYLLGEERFHQKMQELLQRDVGTSTGIKELFGMVPSKDYPRIFPYIETLEVRPGFEAFLTFLQQREIPFIIVSVGIREMIERVLAPYRDKITAYYYGELSTAGEFLTNSSPYDDGVDLLRKELVMKQYPCQTSIFLGDSYTDRNPALRSDIVFARDRLDLFLQEKELPHHTFETFFDVIKVLEQEGITNVTGSLK